MTLDEAARLQELIDSGMAWRLEGAVGREAYAAIEAGYCMLGEQSHKDYWGNHVPSRTEVEPGSVGSREYFEARQDELEYDWADDDDDPQCTCTIRPWHADDCPVGQADRMSE